MSFALLQPVHFLPYSFSNGASEVAQVLERKRTEARYKAQFPPGRALIFDELRSIVASFHPLDAELAHKTMSVARDFLSVLPTDSVSPELSFDPDGEIAFDWSRGSNLLSVSVGASGRVSYAADVDEVPTSGTVDFDGEIPAGLMEAISSFRVHSVEAA